MNRKSKIGAVLIVLALALLVPAAVVFPSIILPLCIGTLGVFGVVVTTYATFLAGDAPHEGYAGGLVAPTATQSQTVNAVCAQVFMDDTDTTATITHNFGLTTAQLACLFPFIQWYVDTFKNPSTAIYPVLNWTRAANTVTITKVSATSSGGTYNVIIRRPWSASE
jgi:hypothetical protein